MLDERQFYSEVTPNNIQERLLCVAEPLRSRIMGDLYYEGMLGGIHPQNTRELYLECYCKSADLGDMISMVEYEAHRDGESKYADQIDDSDPLAWALHLQYTNRLEESLPYLLPLVDTSLRALYACWSIGGVAGNDDQSCQKLLESRYLPAIPDVAQRYMRFTPIARYAFAVGSYFGNPVLRRRFLMQQQDTMEPRQLALLATSHPFSTNFITERIHKHIAPVERYIYGQLGYTGWGTTEKYLKIRQDVLNWINCFTLCLMHMRNVPRDIRNLLTEWVWCVRYDYLEGRTKTQSRTKVHSDLTAD